MNEKKEQNDIKEMSCRMEYPGMGWWVEENNEKSGKKQIEYEEEISRMEFVFQSIQIRN
jgi:hypothetical protein